MTETSLPSIAAGFRLLASRFQDFARRAEKSRHLLTNIAQTGIRAGRLLQDAAEAGAFEGESWWRDGKSPLHPYDDGKGCFIRYESDAEFFFQLWSTAIGSWLAERFPGRFRHDAAEWDWAHVATDEEGRLLGEDGKPLYGQWYKDGKPLPEGFRWTPQCPHGEYAWRLEGKVAYREDSYDEADCLEHSRIRAEVYMDACCLLAEMVSDPHPSQASDVPATAKHDLQRAASRGMTKRSEHAGGSEYLECNGIERFVVTYVSRFQSTYRNHRPWNTQELCLQELVDDVNENACPTTFDEVQGAVEQCIVRGWIEWATTEDGEHILRRTRRGSQAYGYGPDGEPVYPEATTSDPNQAIRVILHVLYEAKHDSQLRYRGDPRVRDREVMDSDLYSWARHQGVSRDAFREAETECLGEGFMVSTPCNGGAWCRITSRGERFLRGEPTTDPEPVDRLVDKSRAERKKAGGRPPLSKCEARKREQLVERWNRAKAGGVRQKDFCVDEGVSLKHLTTCMNWFAQRRRRNNKP